MSYSSRFVSFISNAATVCLVVTAESVPILDAAPAPEERLLGLLRSPKAQVSIMVDRAGVSERVDLEPQTLALLKEVLAHRHEGASLQVLRAEDEMTTQQAADFLGVSRPHVVKLIKEKELPHHMVGSHHRVLARDVFRYDEARKQERREMAAKATAEARELGLYDDPVPHR